MYKRQVHRDALGPKGHHLLQCAGETTRALVGQAVDEIDAVSYTHLRAHETVLDLVCRLLLEKNKTSYTNTQYTFI